MNGDAKEIYERIVTLETMMVERWNAHDQRGRDLIKLIEEKFLGLPCIARVKSTNREFRLVWTFITIIIIAMVGVSVKVLWAK